MKRSTTAMKVPMIVAAVVVAAGVAGAAFWLLSGGEEAFEDVTLDLELVSPDDLSLSPLDAAALPMFGFDGFDGSLAFAGFEGGASAGDVLLTAPSTDVTAPTADPFTFSLDLSGIGSAFASQAPQAQQPPAGSTPPDTSEPEDTPPAEQPPAEEPPQSQVNSGNCAQFASMPSASYCSAVGDPNGRTLCQQCKAAGY